jgi:hypothetical protein
MFRRLSFRSLWLVVPAALISIVGCPEPEEEAPPAQRHAAAAPVVCRIESASQNLIEGGELTVAVHCALPPSGSATQLNCELKGTGVEVLQADRRMIRGVGTHRFVFRVPGPKAASSVTVAAWLGTDWRKPVVPIAYTKAIPVTGRAEFAERQKNQAQAEGLLTKVNYARNDKGNVALLAGNWPGQDRVVIDALAATMRKRGVEVSLIDGEAFFNPAVVTPERFDLLIVTGGRKLPVDAAASLSRYLGARGNLMVVGTPLFADPLCRVGGQWMTRADVQAKLTATPTARILFDFETGGLDGWARTSDKPSNPVTFEVAADGANGGRRSMHAVIRDLTGWETFASPALAQGAVPAGHAVTCFWAKGGPRTKALSIEWNERDGSRWIGTVPLTPQWKYYVLTPVSFAYWHDSPTGGNRGKPGDRFNPANATRIVFGQAFSHTGLQGGAHEFWVDQVGMAPSPLGEWVEAPRPEFPPTDMLWPGYKCYRATDVARLRAGSMQTLMEPGDLPLAKTLWCPHQRPQGTGFNKGRTWRMITVAEAVSNEGDFRGPALAVMVSQPDGGRAHAWSALATDDATFVTAPATLNTLASVAERMIDGVFLLEGGSEFYTCFQGESVKLGARVVNAGRSRQQDVAVRIRVHAGGAEAFGQAFTGTVRPGDAPAAFECRWGPDRLSPKGYSVAVELIRNGRVVDRVIHELGVWEPKASPQFVTARDGDFYLAGRKWYPYGVNHMPASGIGVEDGPLFERYLAKQAYDAEIFDRELARIKAMGMNMVSAFIYHDAHRDRNLLDYIRRCEKYGLKVNLSLRPGTPMDFEWQKMREIIVESRLAENDTVFAYDLAWEPFIGRQAERIRWDKGWGEWVQRHYGSIDGAEKAWGLKAPRNQDGYITNPSDSMCGADGPWRKMVCDYRRFIDEVVDRHYGEAKRLVLSVDPHHLVSFRMTVAGDPTFNQANNMPYDFRGLKKCVDLFEPEGYGRIGDWARVRPGIFTVAYARAIDPTKPVMWAEYGVSSWDVQSMETSASSSEFEGKFYDDFLKMVLQSGANGAVCWWYPGGFRVGENSDFGIINLDGTDRPVSKVLRTYARQITEPREIPRPTAWIEYTPDDPAGIEGIYRQVEKPFWQAVESGKVPGLRAK